MTSLPHPVPSRTAHAIAALYGHDDDTLLAWQRACAQAAETLHPQPDDERLRKALTLAQDGHVTLEDDGFATVESRGKHYQVQADGTCDCPDATHRRGACKHALAVQIHYLASAGLRPGGDHRQAPTAVPSAPSPRASQPSARHSAAWDVHEAPVSSCFKIRVGAFEWTHTMRASEDAELHTRVQAFVPMFRAVVAALDALQAEREAAKAAPVPPPPAPALPQGDLQALVQQALQQALSGLAVGGQAPGTPAPAPPSTGQRQAKAKTGDQATGLCSLHHVAMEHRENERGSWYSHWLPEEERHCKGRR